MSYRVSIAKSLSNIITNTLDGTNTTEYYTNIYSNVFTQSKTFSQINDFPAITVTTGPETFEYLPAGLRWANLVLYIRAYVKSEDDAAYQLESLIEDIKNIIDKNDSFSYTVTKPDLSEITLTTTQSTISEISTDEGLLAPLGIGEIVLTIRYSQDTRLV